MNISLPPAHIQSAHWQEWVVGSGVDPTLTALNLRSLYGNTPYDYLLYSDKLPRRNDGRLSEGTLKRYRHLEVGGWWCSGIDPLSLEDSLWGCFKPDFPRSSAEGKAIKYEHPPKVETELFVLRVQFLITWKIARRQNEQAYLDWFERFWTTAKPYLEQEYPEFTQTNRDSNRSSSSEPQSLRELYFACQRGEHTEVNRLLQALWDSARYDSTKLEFFSQRRVERLISLEDKGFWSWVKDNSIPITLTEGTKKAGSLLTAGYCAIALPGIFNGYRQAKDEQDNKSGKPYLIPQLAALAQKERSFYFAFDEDSKPQTIHHVNLATSATARLLEEKGCQCYVLNWTKQYKGVDDLIVQGGEEAFEQAYSQVQPLALWQVSQLKQLTYPVSVEIDRHLRYLPPLEIPPSEKLICLKARKGRGKTQQIAPIVEKASAQGIPTLIIGHRRQLVDDLCRRCGIDTVMSMRSSDTKGILGYGLCIDSLRRNSQALFDPANWSEAIVIIDECEQVLWHMLNAETEVKKHRVEVLRNFRQLIRNVANSGRGKIVLSDADLSDISIDYIRGLIGFPVDPYIIFQSTDPSSINSSERWEVTNYPDSNPKRLVADLVGHIQLGGQPFVCVSGQKRKSKYGTRNLEATLSSLFPHKKILRIDSESIANPKHPAYGCIAHLNEVLPQYDIVLASPSIETGVSIDIRGHFSSVWCIAAGVSADNAVCQSLARVRENVPRFIWAAKSSFCRVANGTTSIPALLDSQHHQSEANLKLLLQAEEWEYYCIDRSSQSHSLACWARSSVRLNLGMMKYRGSIKAALIEEGHRIRDVGEDFDQGLVEEVNQSLQETKVANYQSYCLSVSQTVNPNDLFYEQLCRKLSLDDDEMLQLRKGQLCRRYLTEDIKPELVEADEKGLYAGMRLHYYLTVGREYLKRRDRSVLENLLHQGQGSLWSPDFNDSQLGAKVWLLEWLKIPALLTKPTLHKDDSDLIALEKVVKGFRHDIKKILGITIGEKDSPVLVYRKLLRPLGVRRLPRLGRFGEREQRRYVYANPDLSEREETFTRWLAHEQGKDETFAAAENEKELEWAMQMLSHLERPSRRFPSVEDATRFVNLVELKLQSFVPQIQNSCKNFFSRFWEAISYKISLLNV